MALVRLSGRLAPWKCFVDGWNMEKELLSAVVSCPVKSALSLAELSPLFIAFGIFRVWGSGEGQLLHCKTLASFYKRKALQRPLPGSLWW